MLLAPMFLGACGNDINLARIAAVETVNAYRTSNDVHLIAIAQIIACGLAALGSLSLSMADDISVSMALRLRGNANALNRSAEQNHRRAAQGTQPTQPTQAHAPPPPPPPPPDLPEPPDLQYEATVAATVAKTQKRVDQIQSRPPVPPTQTQQDRQNQEIWAAAMTEIAGEYTSGLHNLPPAERKMASLRASALSSCANELLSGAVPPRLRPGDLAGLFRPRTT